MVCNWPPYRNDNQWIVGRLSQSRMNLFPEKTNRSLAGCDLGNFFLFRRESTEKFPEGHSLICLNGFVLKPVCPRGTLYNGLSRKSPFFMLQVCERVGISLGMWKGGDICYIGVQKGPKGLTDTFYGCEKVERTGIGIYPLDLFKTVI